MNSIDITNETGLRPARPFFASNEVCRYYLRGTCRFEELCSFAHILPNELRRQDQNNENSTISSSNETGAATATTTTTTSPSTLSSSLSSTTTGTRGSIAINKSTWAMAPSFVPHKKLIKANQTANSDLDESTMPPPSTTTTEGSIIPLKDETKSYAEVVGGGGGIGIQSYDNSGAWGGGESELCPFFYGCPFGDKCTFVHGEKCEFCLSYCLHPSDKEQRRKHIAKCVQQHEKNMELSFAIARSQDKTCGICFDKIVEKAGHEQRFGILPNCNHVFCLSCIRKWRVAKNFDNKIIRACPECRTASDFVCPSAFWVDTKEEKDKLIRDYKTALGKKDCKYFKMGKGECLFGRRCFYKHALPNGVIVPTGRAERPYSSLLDDLLNDFLERYTIERSFSEIVSDSD